MNKKMILFLTAAVLLLSGCGGEKYEPFKPLSQVTPDPARIAAIQDALGAEGDSDITVVISGEDEDTGVSFDEGTSSLHNDPYFAEVGEIETAVSVTAEESVSAEIVVDDDPFAEPVEEPTALPIPTAVPEFSAVNPYGTNENGLTTYTLQQGEDVVCLGRRFGISVSQLLTLNQLEDVNAAGAGSVITLPKNAQQWKSTDGYGNVILQRHPAYYVVQSGDTMFSIACAFGNVRPEAIAEGNDMKLGEALQPGTQIYIP